jgi:hypothetical protein
LGRTYQLPGDGFNSLLLAAGYFIPPGKGLSSPTVNVYWGMFNLVIGYLLVRGDKISNDNKWGIVLLFVSVLVMGIMLSYSFVGIQRSAGV